MNPAPALVRRADSPWVSSPWSRSWPRAPSCSQPVGSTAANGGAAKAFPDRRAEAWRKPSCSGHRSLSKKSRGVPILDLYPG